MSSPSEHVFTSMATVFILQDKNWIERGAGLVKFVFDLQSYQLRLIINPNTSQQFDCRLRPRIRSKGPRAYVVRAYSMNEKNVEEEHILAIRFDREIDSRSFRQFVEERDQPPSYTDLRIQSQPHLSSRNTLPMFHGKRRISADEREVIHHSIEYNQPFSRNEIDSHDQNINHPTTSRRNPPGNLGPVNQRADAFFWTCSRCTMMNDASVTKCYVCDTPRGNTNTKEKSSHPKRKQSRTKEERMERLKNQIEKKDRQGWSGRSKDPSLASPTSNGAHTPHRQRDVVFHSLTTQNLSRFNQLYPPQRRQVGEIIQEQIRLLSDDFKKL